VSVKMMTDLVDSLNTGENTENVTGN